MEPHEVVSEFWARMQARDWDGLSALLAEDVVVDWPDTGVRIRGRDKYVDFNREYPEGWTLELLTSIAQENTVVSEVRVPHGAHGTYYLVSILEVQHDRVIGGREYWLEQQKQSVAADRARWFEPI